VARIVALLLILTGCSRLTIRTLGPGPHAAPPACTSSSSPVKKDFLAAAITAAAGLTMIVAGAATSEVEDDPITGEQRQLNALFYAGAITLVVGVPIFALSGGWGLREVRRCRAAQATFTRGE
jgi:hypothetical protein